MLNLPPKIPSQTLLKADVVILGAGTGGVAAALAVLRAGYSVLLTEETDWIGSQFTSQAIPPDEHRWIEEFGCTQSYRALRTGIRDYYRHWYPLTPEAAADPRLNPGSGYVSRLCHEPRVSLAVLEAMLQPYRASGRLQLLLQHTPVAATTDGDRVTSVTVSHLPSGEIVTLIAPYFLDATELGEVLPLADVEHVLGAESQSETGEPHAVTGPAQPLNQQSITWCFAVSHHPGEDHTISKPEQYDFWRAYRADFWPGPQLSWTYPHPSRVAPMTRVLLPEELCEGRVDIWRYRRILAAQNLIDGGPGADIALVNWPQNDYWLGPIAGVPEAEVQRNLEGARQLSLSLLYWMQVEAPRPDGGTGYPGLKIRPDVTGTPDGLAKYPYVRESRRIRAEFTVLEQHIASDLCPEGAAKFHDSAGIGSYRIDLHPSTAGQSYIDIGSCPFQIPLGSLIPQRVENLLPACKNLGVTHITNGCYRVHPVEWNIGEAAGALAAHCLQTRSSPRAVRNTPEKLATFQQFLRIQGVELDWPPGLAL